MQELAEVRLTAWVHGHVQGVGFRWWTRSRALELGLTGLRRRTSPTGVSKSSRRVRGTPASACLTCWKAETPRAVSTKVVADWTEVGDAMTGFTER